MLRGFENRLLIYPLVPLVGSLLEEKNGFSSNWKSVFLHFSLFTSSESGSSEFFVYPPVRKIVFY